MNEFKTIETMKNEKSQNETSSISHWKAKFELEAGAGVIGNVAKKKEEDENEKDKKKISVLLWIFPVKL